MNKSTGRQSIVIYWRRGCDHLRHHYRQLTPGCAASLTTGNDDGYWASNSSCRPALDSISEQRATLCVCEKGLASTAIIHLIGVSGERCYGKNLAAAVRVGAGWLGLVGETAGQPAD